MFIDYLAFSPSALERSPYSRNTSSVAGDGLLNTGSAPVVLFGKAITSRIDLAPHRMAMSRSKPAPSSSAYFGIDGSTGHGLLTKSDTAMGWSTEFKRLKKVREPADLLIVKLSPQSDPVSM